MMPNSNYTSSLLFGIQWDLVCKFLEVKSGLATANINSDSSTWGNYNNAKIKNINSGKYSIYNESSLGMWTKISDSYIKQDSGNDYRTLLSTGISDYTNKMNIYDFAGNGWKGTLEHATSFSSIPCASRGGSYSVIVILALTFQHLTEAMLVQQATLMTLDLDLHFMVIREYKLKY